MKSGTTTTTPPLLLQLLILILLIINVTVIPIAIGAIKMVSKKPEKGFE